MISHYIITAAVLMMGVPCMAQQRGGITDTHGSQHAVMNAVPLNAVTWNQGFWGERFEVFSKTSLQSMWATWQTDEGKGFNNFLIASGEKRGVHHGPPFHDGDMYKWLEAVAAIYAVNHDPELDRIMDRFIGCVVKSQRADGYIHTPVIIAELYRETGDPKYLELSKQFIDIRGMVKNGTDDNQDRIPFREQYNAMGHAVRANYLYAGVTDLFIEDGEEQLMRNLTSIWDDIVTRKMYITGACGALYDGTSPDGTDYKPDNIQKVHQSYGRPYQLPQSTAHNETCANIGNMLFNWRMLLATGNGKYADIMENCYYNSILSGISLDGECYFYTNPLRISDELPYTLRWPKERKKYISCFCCPPNTLRTLCEVQDYAYAVGKNEISVNLYGANTLTTAVDGVGAITLTQETDYPWNGKVTLRISQLKGKKTITFRLRHPEWSRTMQVSASNGVTATEDNGYLILSGTWRKGDAITIDMPMETHIVEANPLVEEARGQVAVLRGPIVYCAESQDLGGADIDDIVIPTDTRFTPVETRIAGSRIMALEGEVLVRSEASWKGTLYRDASAKKQKKTIRLIPYYAWGNRGKSEMTVWMPAGY